MRLSSLEERGEIEFLRGSSLSKKQIVSEGRHSCIHYGELYTLYGPVIDRVVSKTNEPGKVKSIPGDVLIPGTTTADAMGIAIARSLNQSDVVIGGDINVMRTRNKILMADFAAWLLSIGLKEQLATCAKGTNILHLTNKDIKFLQIPLPPIEAQREIVAEINRYQKIIDGAQQVIDNWKPTIEVDPEWPLVELGEVCEMGSGNPAPQDKSLFEHGGHPFCRVSDVGKVHVSSNLREIRDHLSDEGAKGLRLYGPDTILFPKSGASVLLNHRAMLSISSYVSSHLATITVNKQKANPLFIFWILVNADAKELTSGQDYPSVKLADIAKIQIPLPSIDKQNDVAGNLKVQERLLYALRMLTLSQREKIRRTLERATATD